MKYGTSMQTYGTVVPGSGRIRNIKTLSKPAKQRLKWMDHYRKHNNARLTCRHFDLSPDVFYRWKNRYNPYDLSTLEDDTAGRKPKQVRTPETSPELTGRIKALREKYPRWGKKKLHAILEKEGFRTSESTIGRTLNRLRQSGRLEEPAVVTARLAGKKRRSVSKRPHAERRDWEYGVENPGDLVQLDTLHIYTEDREKRYQFTAEDYISKHIARAAASRITSSAACRILDAIERQMPSPVNVIQVDGGSEWMQVFEKACAQAGIRLMVLPPKREQDNTYNSVRPHEALGMLTPEEYHESISNKPAPMCT
ncbi:hypothetical protein BRC19_01435 [Candidatus Saccharibacteria bacterium QS_5_54_17]|nr:MAG: hypothetical protein BRC19_01435 [Candidatus Saccharibacteria bacterium QS_5_54_17]